MNDLIEALTILSKYKEADTYSPTHCEHDELFVMGIDHDSITEEDAARLKELGFYRSSEHPESYTSFRFGSA